MNNECINDGNTISEKEIQFLIESGYNINKLRDFSIRNDLDIKFNADQKYIFNFVGFITNQFGKMITIYPKNYSCDLSNDADKRNLFKSIFKHKLKKPETYIGEEYKKNISTNYPFSAFFSIYNYFEKYGIHFNLKKTTKAFGKGRINWKETIRLSQKFILDGSLVMTPIYYNETVKENSFLSNCMIFAIDYTIEKFTSIIEKEKTNMPFPNLDIDNNKKLIIQRLEFIRFRTYSDININLVDNLIKFFSEFKSSGKYYLKHYAYANIWEDMVMDYLNKYFEKIENNKIKLSSKELKIKNKFTKPSFYPNLNNTRQSIQPDHYFSYDKTQVILDAKYYEPTSLDYKQISYLFFLKKMKKEGGKEKKFIKTYSALIIPSNKRNSKIHFKLNPIFNDDFDEFVIYEERLDIRDVIKSWVG